MHAAILLDLRMFRNRRKHLPRDIPRLHELDGSRLASTQAGSHFGAGHRDPLLLAITYFTH